LIDPLLAAGCLQQLGDVDGALAAAMPLLEEAASAAPSAAQAVQPPPARLRWQGPSALVADLVLARCL
jgi:hypothetical protein